MLASRNNHPECVKLLLAAHANVNLQSVGGITALMFASYNNHLECVKLSTSSPQTDVDLRDTNEGYTALMLAIKGGHLDCVKLLLSARANLSVEDKFANTAFTIDLLFNQRRFGKLLLTHHLLSLVGKRKRRVLPFPVAGGHTALWDIVSEYALSSGM